MGKEKRAAFSRHIPDADPDADAGTVTGIGTKPSAFFSILWLLSCLPMSACLIQGKQAGQASQQEQGIDKQIAPAASAVVPRDKQSEQGIEPARPRKNVNYQQLRQRIIYGKATLAEVRQVLGEQDVAALTNTVHALYSMRWHRGVFKLLYSLWQGNKAQYPELNWEELSKAPVRIALASTLNRIQIADTEVFQDYIRAFKDHEHEFVRAQVAVALGFNGDPQDIDYLKQRVDGDQHYVIQSAITALALMGGNQARDAMIALWERHRGRPRGKLLLELLRHAYAWQPPAEQGQEHDRETLENSVQGSSP